MENLKETDLVAPSYTPPWNALTSGRLADLLSRFLPAIFFLAAVRGKLAELISFLNRPENDRPGLGNLAFQVSVGSRISVILFLVLLASLFVLRGKPVKKASGLSPRLMAITGTFLMSAVTLFPRAELGLLQTVTATCLVLLGTSASIFVLFWLGRSFSLMAEARRLVTSGPYSVVRHPLYLAEEIAVIGATLQFVSVFTFVIFGFHLWIQIQRMKNEEAVLRGAFPDYNNYQARTARLIPGVY